MSDVELQFAEDPDRVAQMQAAFAEVRERSLVVQQAGTDVAIPVGQVPGKLTDPDMVDQLALASSN